MLQLLVLLGCSQPAAEPADATLTTTTGSETTEVEEPSPWIYDEEEAPSPELGAADLESTIAEAVDLVLDLHAHPVLDGYNAAMDDEGSLCPAYYAAEDGSTYWYDYCESETGASFNGYGFYYLYEDYYDANAGYTYDGEGVYAAATITTADGEQFSGAGTGYYIDAWAGEGDEELLYFYSLVEGSFSWTGPETEGSWMADGFQPDLEMGMYLLPAHDLRLGVVHGGVSGLGGDVDTVVFDSVYLWDDLLTTSGCDIEPSGTVSIRQSSGEWYDVLFDGPLSEEAVVPEGECDGCGHAWFQGEAVGEVCVDFGALTGWGDRPW